MKQQQELIPGLPDDLSLECLIRTHYTDFSSISSVSNSWNNQIALPHFLRYRKNCGKSRVVIAMAQSDRLSNHKGGGTSTTDDQANCYRYRVTLLEPETGNWSELPLPPWCPDGLPIFCRMAEFGSGIVVMGGWDPKTLMVSRSVYVYSFMTAKWSRGAQLPEPARSFFACTAVKGVIYVAGGHDEGKNALKSVLAYDVAKDDWERLPDMATERDECHAVIHRGKLHVIGGYGSDMQGRFEKSAEVLNLETKQWEEAVNGADFLDVSMGHKVCTTCESNLYTCRGGHVAVQDAEGKWKNVVRMPSGIGDVAFAAAWENEKMVVIGVSNRDDRRSIGYVLNLKSLQWSQLTQLDKYSGNIHAGCYFTL